VEINKMRKSEVGIPTKEVPDTIKFFYKWSYWFWRNVNRLVDQNITVPDE